MAKAVDGKIAKFKPQTRNGNKHTQRGMGMLESSMRQYGYVSPMTAAADGEIIDGSARIETSATVFGDDAIVVHHDGTKPVIMVRDDIPSADTPEARAISMAANRIAQVNLDFDAEVILQDLAAGVDLDQFWRKDELDELLADLQPKTTGDTPAETDRAEELREKWGTAPNQLWALGEHRLLCASCLEPENITRLLGGETPTMIFADPPYGISVVAANVSVGGGEGPNGMIPFGGVKGKRLGSANAAKPFGSNYVRGTIGAAHVVDVGKYAPIIGDETTETAVRSSTVLLAQFPKAVHVWWGGNYYANTLPASSCWLVWNKETTGNFADCELAWTNQPKAAKLFTHRWNGMLRDSERERRFHPTQKPAALADWVFTELGAEGDVILDPFLGSGPTVIAAEQTNRRVFGLEMSAEYIAIILERWSVHTGRQPVLLDI